MLIPIFLFDNIFNLHDRACVVSLIDIALVKSDSILNLPTVRDQKIIKSLAKKHLIVVLGWDREGQSKDLSNFQCEYSLFRFTAPYVTSRFEAIRLVACYPIFWLWTLIKLCHYSPRCVHACDLGTAPPCHLYKILFRRKMVFDVFDRYAMAYIPKNRNFFFRFIYFMVNRIEEYYASKADVLINVSDELLKTYRKRPKICVTIMNCSEDRMEGVSKVKSNRFRVLFSGHIRKGRGLEVLSGVVKGLKDVELVITGRAQDKQLLSTLNGISNITYRGYLDEHKLLDLEANSDVMVALYDLDLQTQNEFVVGNKLFKAMMWGIPIITNVACEIVKETGCGILVNYDNSDELRNAIINLKDNTELSRRLGGNGRRAFLEKYNWKIMEQRLYDIYEGLLNPR